MSLFRINTNNTAITAQRNLRGASNQLAEAQERLSSGLRINSASDDAAGLAISQKTTTQVRGLNQASTNAQDGISMLQTAEGGLEETQNSLQRQRELAVQASNDSLTEQDREQIQREVDALSKEIQRISDQTQFNTKNLLDGSLETDGNLGDQQLQVGANDGETIEFNIADMGTSEDALDVAGNGEAQNVEKFSASAANISSADTKLEVKEVADGDGGTEYKLQEDGETVGSSADGVKYSVNSGADFAGASASIKLGAKVQDGQKFAVSGTSIDTSSLKSPEITAKDTKLEAGDYTVSVKNPGAGSGGKEVTLLNEENDQVATLQSGPGTAGKFQNVDNDTKLDFSDTTASGLIMNADGSGSAANVFEDGQTISIGGPDITSTDDAKEAIQTLDTAIEDVSSERAEIGALQNRLETTISVNDITSENLKAARSRIRDADIAEESLKQTRAQILLEAGTSVLAQANQNPQSALQLLGTNGS